MGTHPAYPGLLMHQLRYADEIKSFDGVIAGELPIAQEAELDLAKQIIQQRSTATFVPQNYEDEVKKNGC